MLFFHPNSFTPKLAMLAWTSFLTFSCLNQASAMPPKKGQDQKKMDTSKTGLYGDRAARLAASDPTYNRLIALVQDFGDNEVEAEENANAAILIHRTRPDREALVYESLELLDFWNERYLAYREFVEELEQLEQRADVRIFLEKAKKQWRAAEIKLEVFQGQGYETVLVDDPELADNMYKATKFQSVRDRRRAIKAGRKKLDLLDANGDQSSERLAAYAAMLVKQEEQAEAREAADLKADEAHKALVAQRKTAKNRKKKIGRAKNALNAEQALTQSSQALTDQQEQELQTQAALREQAKREDEKRTAEQESRQKAEERSAKEQLRKLRAQIEAEAAANSSAGTGAGAGVGAGAGASSSLPSRTWPIDESRIEKDLEAVHGPDRAAITSIITALHENGHNLSYNQSRPVGEALFELRPRGDRGDYRIFYAEYRNGYVLLRLTTHDNWSAEKRLAVLDLAELTQESPETPED